MAFVNKSNTKKIYAYLTKQGREKILTGDTADFIITQFSLHDDDVNYEISSNKIGLNYNTLPSGFIPDVTGDNQECTLSVAEQLLRNELFGSIPVVVKITGCGISTATNYIANADVIDNTLCIFPPPQPLVLTDVTGQCDTEPFKFKISVNNIDGGTPPYKWYVTSSFGDNDSPPYNTLRNEGESFIFDTLNTQGTATYTVKISDSSTPKITAEKTFTNISCTPIGPYIKISAYCESDWVLNRSLIGTRPFTYPNRPAWAYKIQIEYVSPQRPWEYIIVSKALSPTQTNILLSATEYNQLDHDVWDGTSSPAGTTRPTAPIYLGPTFPTNPYGFLEDRNYFNNEYNPYYTQTITLPGNVGRPIDYKIIFYDGSLSYSNQAINRVTAFTVTNVSCQPRKIILRVVKVTKPIFYGYGGGPASFAVVGWGTLNPYVAFDFNSTNPPICVQWYESQATNYLDPDIAPTRIMKFERYSQDYGFIDIPNPGGYAPPQSIRNAYNLQANLFPLEIAIPFYIAYDDYGNDYQDIYLFDKTHIPQDLKVQFRTVTPFNKNNIKFPTGIGPNIDWTEDASGAMVSPEYTLSVIANPSVEQTWTYNGRTQRPVFRRFDYETGPNGDGFFKDDGVGNYHLLAPGVIENSNEGLISYPSQNYYSSFNINGDSDNLEPQPIWGLGSMFRGQYANINNYLTNNTTVTELGSTMYSDPSWFGRKRESIVYRFILPIRFNPKPNTNTTGPRAVLELEVEMICNHPDISTIPHYNFYDTENYQTQKNYSSNTFKIQLDVPASQVF
jgi:hypothetical protein